jgi:hypothetical protein
MYSLFGKPEGTLRVNNIYYGIIFQDRIFSLWKIFFFQYFPIILQENIF